MADTTRTLTDTDTGAVVDALAAPMPAPLEVSASDATLAAIADHISAVAQKVSGLTKDGRHDKQGWRFISFEQIVDRLRGPLAAERVRVFPVDSSTQWERFNETRVVYLTVTYVVITPSGTMRMIINSEGADRGDKALTKAWTYAKRLAYLQLFDLGVDGEPDPESHGPDIVEAAHSDELSRLIDRAHALADRGSSQAIRAMLEPSRHLHERPVKVAAWWSDTEIRNTTLKKYLTALIDRVAQAADDGGA